MLKSDIILLIFIYGVFYLKLENEIFDNKYKIVDVLGKGGMSIVYLAKDIKLEKFWAIKQVKKSLNSSIDLLAETNILKNLDHPALPRIVDIIEKNESVYLVMDFIDGISLDKLIIESGMVDEKTVIDWAKQICDVLNYLHCQKPNPIIYRDMKPGNLMLTSRGQIKLIDFGIARKYKKNVSKDTTYIGTRGYAAPEQYGDYQSDARTDIYSLGVTLYHLITGKSPNDPPFEIKPIRKLNPSLSEGMEFIIEKCTKQDPNLRYQSIKEMLNDLENIHKLNSKYKVEVRKRYIKIFVSIIMFIFSVFLITSGIFGIKAESIKEYNNMIENGDKQGSLKNTNKAIDSFKAAINKNEEDSKAYIKAINTYLENGQYDQCVDFVETYVTSKNSSLIKDDNLKFVVGMAYFDYENYSKAYKYFDEIKGKKVDNIDALKYYKVVAKALSTLNISKDNEVVESVNNLEKYIDGSSDIHFKIGAYITLAQIYRDNPQVFDGNTDKEISILEKANTLSVDKNNIILYQQLGEAYYSKACELKLEQEKYKLYLNKALENYKIAINAGSQISDSYCKLGMIYKYLDNAGESKNSFQKEIQMFPDDYKGYMELALLEYDGQQKLSSNQRNYSDFIKYYKLTISKKYNENDNEFMNLSQKYNDLKNQGIIR